MLMDQKIPEWFFERSLEFLGMKAPFLSGDPISELRSRSIGIGAGIEESAKEPCQYWSREDYPL